MSPLCIYIGAAAQVTVLYEFVMIHTCSSLHPRMSRTPSGSSAALGRALYPVSRSRVVSFVYGSFETAVLGVRNQFLTNGHPDLYVGGACLTERDAALYGESGQGRLPATLPPLSCRRLHTITATTGRIKFAPRN